MRLSVCLLLGIAVGVAGCQKSPWAQKTASAQTAATTAAAPATPYNTEITTKDLMDHAIDPAADIVWAASGYVVDMKGTTDLSPTTPEGWKKVEDNATIVAELSNALMLPGRSPEEPKWNQFATRLQGTALAARRAAQRRDKAALLSTGSEMFLACTACHTYYVLGERNGYGTN
jgi:hypothetical protein